MTQDKKFGWEDLPIEIRREIFKMIKFDQLQNFMQTRTVSKEFHHLVFEFSKTHVPIASLRKIALKGTNLTLTMQNC